MQFTGYDLLEIDLHTPFLDIVILRIGRIVTKISAMGRRREFHSALPMFAFAQVIMAHPFSDGNGRFARLMVQAASARGAGLSRPTIALAPAFYRRAETVGDAVTALSESGRLGALQRYFPVSP